jgi:hypothetical protein
VGELTYRGGLALAARDPRWGGLSGLVVSEDGARMTAISDAGTWFVARLRYDQRGWLAGITGVEAGKMPGPTGNPLAGKEEQDAEALAAQPDGSLLVAFERQHRVWHFRARSRPFTRPPSVLAPPPELAGAPTNGGIETLVVLPGGRLFALTEELAEDGLARAWLYASGGWASLSYRLHGDLRPSDGTRLPSGDLLILERSYSPETGVAVRVSRVPASELQAGAVLEGRSMADLRAPLSVDNFEAIAARRGSGGESLVYLLSDDNFSSAQRTLLLMFALPT